MTSVAPSCLQRLLTLAIPVKFSKFKLPLGAFDFHGTFLFIEKCSIIGYARLTWQAN